MNVCSVSCFPKIKASRSSGTIYRGPRKRNYKKENLTECREIEFISSFCSTYTTTVHSASSAAELSTMSIFTGAVIHGGQFNISNSSLNQSPTLATSETEIKSTKRYKKLKVLESDSERNPSVVNLKAYVS